MGARTFFMVLAAGAVSSVLGLRGYLGIWGFSAVGDVVFVCATFASFYGGVSVARHSLVAGSATGLVANWAAYMVSWAATTRTVDLGKVAMFVMEMGWVGLLWCALAVPLIAHLGVRKPSPAPE
jgi:hypothetical protein